MLNSGDRLLDLVGIVLLLVLVSSLSLLVFVGMNPGSVEGDAPNADWSLQRVNASQVEITHTGGEPVSAENLAVIVNGRPRPVSWSGRLTEGDSRVVRVESGQLGLYWTGGSGDRILLKQWQLSAGDS